MSQKLTRLAIKSIVKECLVEILEEGISGQGISSLKESVKRDRTSTKRRVEKRNRGSSLDDISHDRKLKNKNFEKNIVEVTKSMTSDPVLSSILADTAKTTLQEQRSAESMSPGGTAMPTSMAGDVAARAAAKSTPEDLFGESSSKWADLAFSGPANKQ